MLLSRIFSLMLGTTMFVMIWSMQDGDHSRHLRAGAAVPSIRRPEVQPQLAIPPVAEPQPAVSKQPIGVTAVSSSSPVAASSESALWMFADEMPERIAIK